MAWPGSPVPTTNLDAGSDSPATARSDILTAVQDVNSIIAARNAANGIAPLDADSLTPLANLPITPINTGIDVKRTPAVTQNWAVPAGVTRVRVRACGAGGGGGYTSAGTGGDHGGGGGGGGYIEHVFTVVPGSNFTYQVGAGGPGGPSSGDNDGTDGGDTTVTSPASATPSSYTITARGGTGGKGPATRFGGGGGSLVNGDLGIEGGAGASGASRGGMGGSSGMGGPGNATNVLLYGAGGGGFGSGNGTAGFPGKNGLVVFEW